MICRGRPVLRLTMAVLLFLFGVFSSIPASAAAEAAYQCVCSGVERNGERKAQLNMMLDGEGNLLSGKMDISQVCRPKLNAAGGVLTYSDGAKINRNVDQYEWVVDANWTGENQNCDKSLTKTQGSFMVRKFKIQNVAELQLKSREFSTWFVFPHGCDCKSPESKP